MKNAKRKLYNNLKETKKEKKTEKVKQLTQNKMDKNPKISVSTINITWLNTSCNLKGKE